jgi:hypothetical protein
VTFLLGGVPARSNPWHRVAKFSAAVSWDVLLGSAPAFALALAAAAGRRLSVRRATDAAFAFGVEKAFIDRRLSNLIL